MRRLILIDSDNDVDFYCNYCKKEFFKVFDLIKCEYILIGITRTNVFFLRYDHSSPVLTLKSSMFYIEEYQNKINDKKAYYKIDYNVSDKIKLEIKEEYPEYFI